MKGYLVRSAVAAALVLMAGTASAQAPSAPYPGRVEGKVTDVNRTWQTVTMDDRTGLTATSPAQIANLRPGASISVNYIADGDRNEITDISLLAH